MGSGVFDGGGVLVREGVSVGVLDGVGVFVTVNEAVGVIDGVMEGVDVFVTVGEGVRVADGVIEGVNDGTIVAVLVGCGVIVLRAGKGSDRPGSISVMAVATIVPSGVV